MTKTYCVASIWEKEIYLLIFCSKIINLKCPIAQNIGCLQNSSFSALTMTGLSTLLCTQFGPPSILRARFQSVHPVTQCSRSFRKNKAQNSSFADTCSCFVVMGGGGYLIQRWLDNWLIFLVFFFFGWQNYDQIKSKLEFLHKLSYICLHLNEIKKIINLLFSQQVYGSIGLIALKFIKYMYHDRHIIRQLSFKKFLDNYQNFRSMKEELPALYHQHIPPRVSSSQG